MSGASSRRSTSSTGVRSPPPPNQLVFVTTETPWPSESLWDPVWVSGRLSAKAMSTQIAEVGYQIAAEKIEAYEWK